MFRYEYLEGISSKMSQTPNIIYWGNLTEKNCDDLIREKYLNEFLLIFLFYKYIYSLWIFFYTF